MARWSFIVALCCTLMLVLLLLQQFLGVGLTGTVILDDLERDELAWKTSLSRELRDDPVVRARAVVLENSEPLAWRTTSNREVRELGRGRYHVRGNVLRLSSSDGTEVGSNGRIYEMRYPLRVHPRVMMVTVGLTLLAWAWAIRVRRRQSVLAGEASGQTATNRIGSARDWVGWLVLGACAVLAVLVWTGMRPYTDGWFSVKNLPYSDAYAWNLMGEQIATGEEITAFPGQRRLFPWMLAGVYAWTGSWLWAMGLVQLAFVTAVGVLVYALAAPLAGSRWVGAAAALATVASPVLMAVAQVPLTEACGLVFSLAAVLLLWQGVVRRRLWLVAIAGLLYGLGNLACPFSFLAAPLYALLVLAYDWRVERGLWRRLRATVLLTVVVTGVYVPWLVFQKNALGTFTFSSNSAGLLYGAVSEDGSWGPAMMREAEEAGFEGYSIERDAFFMGRFLETVREDPLGYAALVGERSMDFLGSLDRSQPGPLAAALAGLLVMAAVVMWRRQLLAPLLAWLPLAWLAWWSHDLPPWVILTAAIPVLAVLSGGRERLLLAMVVSTGLAVIVINAMTGNLMPRRGWVFMDWMLISLWMAALARCLLLLAAAFGRAEKTVLGWFGSRSGAGAVAGDATPEPKGGHEAKRHDPGGSLPAAAVAVVVTLFVWLGLSAVKLSAVRLSGPEKLDQLLAEGAAERAREQLDLGEEVSGRLVILTDHQAEMAPGEEVGHYSRAFDRQEVRTTVVRPLAVSADGTFGRGGLVRFAGSLENLPTTTPWLLLTVESFDDSRPLSEAWLKEAVALVGVIADEDGVLRPDFDRVRRFEPLEPAAGPDAD